MIPKFRTSTVGWEAKIDRVMIEWETKDYVWLNGVRYKKRDRQEVYHDSWLEAKAHIQKNLDEWARYHQKRLDDIEAQYRILTTLKAKGYK